MTTLISYYCTDLKRLSLVLSKDVEKEKYDTVEYEVSKDLLAKIDEGVFQALSEFMDEKLICIREPNKQTEMDCEMEMDEI